MMADIEKIALFFVAYLGIGFIVGGLSIIFDFFEVEYDAPLEQAKVIISISVGWGLFLAIAVILSPIIFVEEWAKENVPRGIRRSADAVLIALFCIAVLALAFGSALYLLLPSILQG